MARSLIRILTAGGLLALAGAAFGQTPTPPATDATQGRTPEPKVEHQVSEDDNVRIEELKVRGQTQNITVHTKRPGVKPYEIVPQSGARDPSQAGDTTGQRVWNVLKF